MSVVVMGAGIEMLIPGTKYRVAEDLEGNKYLRLDSVFNEQIYPLRPLPEKHGRLIDADALKKTFRDAMDDCEGDFKRKEDAEEVRRWVELLCRDFDAQPTIVEAEGE